MPRNIAPGTPVTCTYRMPPTDQPWIHPIYVGIVVDPAEALASEISDDRQRREVVRRILRSGRVAVLYTLGLRWETVDCLREVLDGDAIVLDVEHGGRVDDVREAA